MDKTKVARFKQKLISMREKILENVTNLEHNALNQSLKDQAGNLSGYSIHLADVASDSFDRDLNLTLASKEQNILNDINASLKKIESGEYGNCELCTKEISEDRLKAIPYARLCMDCKQLNEKRRLAE